MKKQQLFTGFLLVGIGVYFLLRQFSIPFIDHIYSWPTLLMLIGLIYLLYSYLSRDYTHIFPGTVLLGIGIHLYGQDYYSFWIHHWAIYPLIIGLGLLLRYYKTRKGLIPGICLVAVSLFGAFSSQDYIWFQWIGQVTFFFETYWPLILIIVGIYLLYSNKNKKSRRGFKKSASSK